MIQLHDLAEIEDTLEVLLLKQQLVDATNALEKAIVRADTVSMWKHEAECDDLLQEIFIKKESILKPYPATEPSELTPMEQQELLPPEWRAKLA